MSNATTGSKLAESLRRAKDTNTQEDTATEPKQVVDTKPAEKPATTAAKPAPKKPVARKPAPKKPATAKPAASKPAPKKPVSKPAPKTTPTKKPAPAAKKEPEKITPMPASRRTWPD